MRLALAAFTAMAVLAVSGCDINTGTPREAKVECNCATPTRAIPGTPDMRGSEGPLSRHRRHYRAASYSQGDRHGYAWRREYSELSVETYDYRSSSRSYSTGESGGESSGGADAYAYAGASAGGSGDGYRVVERGWVDGYGRTHGGGAAAGTPVHYETSARDGARMHPWHGYDADCPDKDRRH